MNLNPFDLRGPDFLLFYATLVVVTIFLTWLRRYLSESGSAQEVESATNEIAKDPYQIAFLRSGRAEALRVTVVSLIERDLLKVNGKKLVCPHFHGSDKTRRPLEKAIMTKFLTEQEARNMFTDPIILSEASAIGEPLTKMKLLPHGDIKAARLGMMLVGLAVLWGMAGTKIYIALSRRHYNIEFLIIMAVIAAIILVSVVNRSRTTLGNQVLSNLNQLFSKLSDRSTSLSADLTSIELTYVAALYGMMALPSALADEVMPLGIQPQQASSNAGGSCGSSSCGGGTSSSDGGGGGGGCGGGGGGCGGCGG